MTMSQWELQSLAAQEEGLVLVEYSVCGENILCWVVDEKGCRHSATQAASDLNWLVEALVLGMLDDMQKRSRSDFNQRLCKIKSKVSQVWPLLHHAVHPRIRMPHAHHMCTHTHTRTHTRARAHTHVRMCALACLYEGAWWRRTVEAPIRISKIPAIHRQRCSIEVR